MRLEGIIGSVGADELADKLHHLSHHGTIEIITLKHEDLARHRLAVKTDAGRDVAIALPRSVDLFDGAVLYLDENLAIIVRAGEQQWLHLRPVDARVALELGYHAGNLHWRVRFEGDDLLIACDGPRESYLARLEAFLVDARVRLIEREQEAGQWHEAIEKGVGSRHSIFIQCNYK